MSPSRSGNEDIITKYNTDIGKVDILIYFQDYPGDSSLVYYTYDVTNWPQGTHYPDGTRDSLTYDKRGNLITKETYQGVAVHLIIHMVQQLRTIMPTSPAVIVDFMLSMYQVLLILK